MVKIYTTPPPIPKRVDSVAKNIDHYFKHDLVKQAEKDDLVLQIEREILNLSPEISDQEIGENDETSLPEMPLPPLPVEITQILPAEENDEKSKPIQPPLVYDGTKSAFSIKRAKYK